MIDLDREALRVAQYVLRSHGDEQMVVEDEERKVKETENFLTKGLGILTESGIYALFVYLLAKRKRQDKDKGKDRGNDPCHYIMQRLFQYLRNKSELCGALNLEQEKVPCLGDEPKESDASNILGWASEQLGDLDRVLLLREFLLRVFTYGRYIAEARKVELQAKESGRGGEGGANL